MNQEKPQEEEEEDFAGQLEKDPTPWKEERISEEQRVEWFEAANMIEERLRQVDARLQAIFLEMRAPKTRTLADPFAEKMVPEISITLGSAELMVIKGSTLNRQDVDLKSVKKRLEKIAKEISVKVEDLLKKTGDRP